MEKSLTWTGTHSIPFFDKQNTPSSMDGVCRAADTKLERAPQTPRLTESVDRPCAIMRAPEWVKMIASCVL